MMIYDIAIVGGGPAGATLARLLSKTYKVLLIEKRMLEVDGVRSDQKSCGGLIAPDAQEILGKFGMGIPKHVLKSPQLFAVRTIDMDHQIERHYQRHYINIDRGAFDDWLLSLVGSSVHVIEQGVFKGYIENPDHVIVQFHACSKDYSIKTKLLIGADGALSLLRRQGFADQPSPKRYISIQEWFDTTDNLNVYGAIFDSETTDFYSWSIPKGDQLIIGSALPCDGNVHHRFSVLKAKLKPYGYHLGEPTQRNGAFVLRPTHPNQICLGKNNVALVGEAAGFISPSSAEGLSYAFKSALALAKSLEEGIEGYSQRYKKRVRPLVQNIILKNLKSPAMYQKHLRYAVMQSGVMSMNMENTHPTLK